MCKGVEGCGRGIGGRVWWGGVEGCGRGRGVWWVGKGVWREGWCVSGVGEQGRAV